MSVKECMEIEDLERLIKKVFGPILIIISPIAIVIFARAVIFKTAVDTPSTKDIIIIFSFCFAGLFLGIYMCWKEYGWFKKKEK